MSHQGFDVIDVLNVAGLRFPNAAPLCSGRPADELCETDRIPNWIDIFTSSKNAEGDSIRRLLGQYNQTSGIIREHIVRLLDNDEGITCNPDQIIVTVGGQESLTLSLLAIFDEVHDVLLATDPCYPGLTALAADLRIPVHPVRSSFNESTPIGAFEEAIKDVFATGRRPRAIYIVPDFDNPTGNYMSLHQRIELLNIATRHDIAIIEDNPYGYFRFEQQKVSSIKALSTTEHEVYFVSTFSKTLFPGVRVGYIVAPDSSNKPISPAAKLASIKNSITVNTSPITQAIVGGMLIESNFTINSYVAYKTAVYKIRRDAMLSALASELESGKQSAESSWTRPTGGFFLTMTLPFEIGRDEFNDLAQNYDVLVLPVAFISSCRENATRIRLAYSNSDVETTRQAIHRLVQYIDYESRTRAVAT